jgi:hypothetical protein
MCPICGKVIQKDAAVTGFPAFLPRAHRHARFSDAVFHRACFERDSAVRDLEGLYARFRRTIDARPRRVTTLADAERWQTEAIAKLWAEPDFAMQAPESR